MMMRSTLRLLRRSLSGAPFPGSPFQRVQRLFDRSRLLVRAYYLLSIYFSASIIPGLHNAVVDTQSWLFLWPVRWLAYVNVVVAADVLMLSWLILSLLAFAFTDSRTVRLLFSAVLLEVAAIANSSGGMNHAYHAWFWMSVLLVFLPTAHATRARKMAFLSVIAGCQTLLLTFYTLAGFQKFGAGAAALQRDLTGNFSSSSLAATLADRMLQTGTQPPLAQVVIDHPWLSQPLFVPIVFIQMMSIIIAFRPRLHQAWGVALIAFHIGTWLLMEILFIQHVALLALFLVASPFAPRKLEWRQALDDIPVAGPALSWVARQVRWRNPRLKPELPSAE